MKALNHRRFCFYPSAAAILTVAAGFSITYLLFSEQLESRWVIAGIGGAFTLLLATYLQIIAIHSRCADEMIAARTSELHLSRQLLQSDKASRKFSELALQLRDRAIELSANAISIYDATDTQFPLSYSNPAFERMTGFRSAELLGRPCHLLHADEHDTAGSEYLARLMKEKQVGNVVLRSKKKDGSLYWSEMHIAPVENSAGVISHFVAAQTDITALKLYEDQLQHRAHYDSLTGLANRVLLRAKLGAAISAASNTQRSVWTLFLSLDRFKLINETLGHYAGDHVLKILAARLTSCVSANDTIARFAGDEFVVLLQEPLNQKAAMSVIENIMSSIAQPITMEEGNFFISCSIGISVFPKDGSDVDLLIQHADSAMHGAKEAGPSSFHFYTPQLNQRALERARLEADLRVALERDEFILHYQPQVDVQSGRIVGMEALIRWQHPERGRISPIEFIGLAEATGLIVPIGAWVIRTACRQIEAWHEMGYADLRISVNLSARQFSDPYLVTSIQAALTDTGIDPRCFELELTESLVMADVERGIKILRDLKALGVSLAVDDFGTGYSSLAYLKRLPIDVLKIDRSFVNDITIDVDDAVIVVSIISLAHNLRLSVVAEGVETEDQLAFLQLHGCDEIQGYHFSRPVSAEEFTLLLKQKKALPSLNSRQEIVPVKLVAV